MALVSPRVHIGTAGWAIPRASAIRCPGDGTNLERYARALNGVEINSSFYRPHAVATYARWAASAPPDFRFAVKVPRTITHELKLAKARAPFVSFLDEVRGLGTRLGPLLVQLPPSLAFDERVASTFFKLVRPLHEAAVVCEPRHATWFSAPAVALFEHYRVARVAADPPPAPGAEAPGGWNGLAYFRLHGAPRKYWSAYRPHSLASLAAAIRDMPDATRDIWCVFDNTAAGAAIENAFALKELLE